MRWNALIYGVLVSVASACAPAPDNDEAAILSSGDDGAPTAAGADGPFGIALNKPLPSNIEKEEIRPNTYKISSPPKSHPDFESVVVAAYPATGVCVVRGIGRDLENDGAGSSIRTKVDQLAASLQTKYGDGEKIDVCVGGDIQCASDYWMMILSSGERAYGRKWENANGEMRRLGIGSIYAAAQASNIQTSYPILEFNSAKKAECEKAENSTGAEAL